MTSEQNEVITRIERHPFGAPVGEWQKGPLSLVVVVRVRTENPLNKSLGNSNVSGFIRANKRAKQRAAARDAVRASMALYGVHAYELVPAVVTLTRISSGHMDDDGLAASQKGVRDGIAEALGINDGGPMVEWRYAQHKGRPKFHAVHVKIERTT